jgi:hypothetical protein
MVKGQSNISTSIVMAGMIAIGIVGFTVDVLLRRLEAEINRRRGSSTCRENEPVCGPILRSAQSLECIQHEQH